jgi:hypothetical protein
VRRDERSESSELRGAGVADGQPVVTHTVGGNVIGASGALKLKLNGGSELSLAGSGSFQFPNALEAGADMR